MNARQERGQHIARTCEITRKGAVWLVPSQSGKGKYTVSPDATDPHCTCPDHQETGVKCKHLFAVEFSIELTKNADGSTTETRTMTVVQRKTYKQNWPAYNRAQHTEKHRFQVLLRNLCDGIAEPPPAKTGRPRVPLADAVFASCYKVYSTVSSRRFNCDLQDAHEAGHLSRPIHPNKVNTFLENPDLKPVLYQLVAESAKPLAVVERDFAVDSSGFAGSKFVRWFDHKWGKERAWHDWVKVQVMCGVKTNVVTAVEVCEQEGADSPHLPGLVKTTAEAFTISEVSADKGYSSVDNHEVIAATGGTPFISFKRVATGWSGGLWEKMLNFFRYKQDEFLAHYHKRSNVESVFSAVKRKFGDSLRSKTKGAMVNEMLCKFVCHNVVTLIHEQEELGIVPEFWRDEPEPDEPRAVLKFPGKMG